MTCTDNQRERMNGAAGQLGVFIGHVCMHLGYHPTATSPKVLLRLALCPIVFTGACNWVCLVLSTIDWSTDVDVENVVVQVCEMHSQLPLARTLTDVECKKRAGNAGVNGGCGWMAPGTDCTNNNWLEGRPKSASSTFLPSLSELVYLLPIKLDSTSLPLRNQLESNPVMSNDDDYLTSFFCQTGLIGLIRWPCRTRRRRGSVGFREAG